MSDEEIYDLACQKIGYDNDYQHDREIFVRGFKAAIGYMEKIKDDVH